MNSHVFRRVIMWLAVASLAGIALISAASWVPPLGTSTGGWTYYSPNSGPSARVMEFIFLCNRIYSALIPIAASSSAVYIYLIERAVRANARLAGFDVHPIVR